MNEKNYNNVFVNMDVPQNIPTDNNQLEQLYLELGKAYYEGAYEDPLPQLLPLFDKITEVCNQKQESEEFYDTLDKGEPSVPQSFQHRCPGCGTELSEDALFCGICGRSVSNDKLPETLCSQCGKQLDADAAFCGYCGAPTGERK